MQFRHGLDRHPKTRHRAALARVMPRLVHHAEILALKGDSYRLQGKELGARPASDWAPRPPPLRPTACAATGGSSRSGVDQLSTVDPWRGVNSQPAQRGRFSTGLDSFASLLLHEGRSVIYVARQLGHGAELTMRTYGHVIDELEGAPRLAAEEAIRMARSTSE